MQNEERKLSEELSREHERREYEVVDPNYCMKLELGENLQMNILFEKNTHLR